jgi:hydrogenase maturation protease
VRHAPIVIGVGNPDRGDDGVGPEAIRRLRGRVPARVVVVTSDGDPGSLIELWAGHEPVVLIDAMSSGAEPGTVRRFAANDGSVPIPVRGGATSTHSLGPGAAIELARSLDRLPDRWVVFGIEGRRFDAGAPLSAEVARALPVVVERVLDELRGGTG